MTSESVLFRGSVCFPKHPENFLQQTITDLRLWFRGQVVVSTWEGQERHLADITGIDTVVLSPDPGPGHIQQYRRQLTSYAAGLEQCQGDRVCVTRTDVRLSRDPFVVSPVVPTTGRYKAFENKLTVGNMMTIHPERMPPKEAWFRVGDWIQVGNKEDIARFASVLDMEHQNAGLFTDCTERLWMLSVINKYSNSKVDLRTYDQQSVDHAWEALLGNFVVRNSLSTLGARNMNWQFQSEFLDVYVTEDEYRIELEARGL